MTAWPSGLRRQLKALVRKGVGSNPTAVSFAPASYVVLDLCRRYFQNAKPTSDTGTRTQVARVKAEYPNQLDYIGLAQASLLRPQLQPAQGRNHPAIRLVSGASLAQLVARRSHNPKVVSSILTGPIII